MTVWKYLLHHWPFIHGIHYSLMNSQYRGDQCRTLMIALLSAWIVVEQIVKVPVIWDTMTLLCNVTLMKTNAFFSTLMPRQNGRLFPDDVLKCIFSNKNVWVSIYIWLKFVPKGPINNIPTLVQTLAWCWPGDKPLSESIMVSLLTHICSTRPQWVKHVSTLAT